jgi:hypothetical protein
MENQHRLIKGYRDLTQEEIALINECKAAGEKVRELTDKLRAADLDQHWISIGVTDLQKGFMALVRGIAKPEFF